MEKICNHCGTNNDNTSKFCRNCGKELESEKPAKKSTNNKLIIIIILVGIVAVLAIGIIAFSMLGTTTPTITNDFGGITMLIPEGSNFVESSSLPNYGTIGGYIMFENGGEHRDKVNSIMFSTVSGGGPPSQVVLDRVEGDVKIYKGTDGEGVYYIEKNVGNYEISIIGRDLQLMLEMINSVQINNPTLNI